MGDNEDPRPRSPPGPGDLVHTRRRELSGNLGAGSVARCADRPARLAAGLCPPSDRGMFAVGGALTAGPATRRPDRRRGQPAHGPRPATSSSTGAVTTPVAPSSAGDRPAASRLQPARTMTWRSAQPGATRAGAATRCHESPKVSAEKGTKSRPAPTAQVPRTTRRSEANSRRPSWCDSRLTSHKYAEKPRPRYRSDRGASDGSAVRVFGDSGAQVLWVVRRAPMAACVSIDGNDAAGSQGRSRWPTMTV